MGSSQRNLFYIRQWYLFYEIVPQVVAQLGNIPQVGGESGKVQQAVGQIGKGETGIVQQLAAQIPWGHNMLIINKCSSAVGGLFSVRETIRNGWSRATLAAQIASNLYRRQGKAIDNFSVTLPDEQSELAKETLKNPYNIRVCGVM